MGAAAVLIGLVVTPAAADLPRKSPRASLVQVLRGGKQALLLDRGTGEYQVVKVGDAVQGFRVTEIEDDQIVLASPAPERFFVLPLVEAGPAGGAANPANANAANANAASQPTTAGSPVTAPAMPAPSTAAPSGDDPLAEPDDGVVDPYGDPQGAKGQAPDVTPDSPDSIGLDPIDPYDTSARSPGEVPSVMAPPDSRAPAAPPRSPAPDSRAPAAPRPPAAPAASSPSSPAKPAAPLADPFPDADDLGPGLDSDSGPNADANPGSDLDPEPDLDVDSLSGPDANIDSAPPAPPPAAAPRSADEKRTLSRRQLDESLADFGALARQMQIEPAKGGGVRIVELERGSFVARLGIERGDVVRRVAGHSIDSVDEAAAAYAVVATAREVLVELERRGKPLRIRYRLTR